MKSRLEVIALAIGCVLLVIGAVGLEAVMTAKPEQPKGVKQQTLPLTQDEIQSDPALRDAVNKQLNQPSDTPSPQGAQAPTPQSTDTVPQAAQQDLQNTGN
ncbi:MAG TPA: hypothetical protein VLG40_02085 [Candidatus Saccharimonas sp.]|nr:hypothetical protein [Candidatus Saccharimonas sp.]